MVKLEKPVDEYNQERFWVPGVNWAEKPKHGKFNI